jgi:hypothetical protein
MGAIVVVLLLALVLAAAVIVYAAYPYRGEQTPVSPRLGDAMRRGVRSLPTVDRDEHDLPSGRRVSRNARANARDHEHR